MPKILYVEDNEDNVYMLSRRLERHGFEVLVAPDGEQGVAIARREHPDLIVMDLNMPVLDGWEATRRLKAAPETRAIPIIALSAHAMAGDRERALEAGCDEYDTKPVRIASLMAKIRTLLPGNGKP
jgi:two-component system cell cycle response regulator DivK